MELKIKEEIKEFYAKIDAVKIENGRYNLELLNQSKELKAECKDFPKYKEDFEIKLKIFTDLNERFRIDFDRISGEFEGFKTKFVDLSEFIRVRLKLKLLYRMFDLEET